MLEQLTYDFEAIIKGVKDDAQKQHSEIVNVLTDLQKKIGNEPKARKKATLKVNPTTAPQTAPSSSAAPPASKSKGPGGRSKEDKAAKPKTGYQRRAKVLFVGDSLVHNTNFSQVEMVTNTTIKTAKAYSSSRDERARFKELNVMDVVKNEQKKGVFHQIVLGAPTVDISNIDTTKIKPSHNTDVFMKMVRVSCQNMTKAAENALANQPELKNITIMNHAPRYDLATFSKIVAGLSNEEQNIHW